LLHAPEANELDALMTFNPAYWLTLTAVAARVSTTTEWS